ncbi:extracellular matrix regulator RemB [Desulfofalx alkaliphila]|uniref:extracellular matrix regulator RemB n=1 Tax=Desulfofalx alkaliphila TaxID=105483 RepID=UPI0004E1F6CD|nr:DUF370 domain-containing protein [Desulfofalx alkaliphila]
MFLHLGGDVMVCKKDVIAIINAKAKQSPVTKEFLEVASDEDFIKSISSEEKEKSVVITTRNIYLSPISCNTLRKRSDISSLTDNT